MLNSFLAISIAYGNELGRIAKLFKLDQYQVIKLLKKDPRLSNVPLMPGVPYSGATLARDVKHLLNYIKSNKSESFHLTNRINNSNNSHKNFIFNQIALHLKKFKLKKVLFIGLTYKLGSSTMRRSVMYEFLKI